MLLVAVVLLLGVLAGALDVLLGVLLLLVVLAGALGVLLLLVVLAGALDVLLVLVVLARALDVLLLAALVTVTVTGGGVDVTVTGACCAKHPWSAAGSSEQSGRPADAASPPIIRPAAAIRATSFARLGLPGCRSAGGRRNGMVDPCICRRSCCSSRPGQARAGRRSEEARREWVGSRLC